MIVNIDEIEIIYKPNEVKEVEQEIEEEMEKNFEYFALIL